MATTVVPQPKSVQDCRPTLLTVVGVKKDNLESSEKNDSQSPTNEVKQAWE